MVGLKCIVRYGENISWEAKIVEPFFSVIRTCNIDLLKLLSDPSYKGFFMWFLWLCKVYGKCLSA